MYEFESRIRYSEVDVNQNLKLTSLINYLQDCSTFQSEDLGIGLNYLYAMDLAWVINNWQIDIIKLPKLGDRVIIGTSPYRLRGFLGHRNFYMKDAESGEYLVKANSIWTLVNIKEVKPVRATQEMIDAYVLSDPLEMEYLDRKVSFQGEEKVMEPIEVTIAHLDTNKHVNNEQYIEMAKKYIPDHFLVKRVVVEYKKAAYLGDTIVAKVVESESFVGVSLDNPEGDTFVKVVFYE